MRIPLSDILGIMICFDKKNPQFLGGKVRKKMIKF